LVRKLCAALTIVAQEIVQLATNEQNADRGAVADDDGARNELGDFAKIEQSGEELTTPIKMRGR